MKYFVSISNKSKAVSGSLIFALPINAAVEASESLKNRSRSFVNGVSKGIKIMRAKRLTKVEKVTRPINGSVIPKVVVITDMILRSNRKAKAVMKMLKRILPSATLFFAALPPTALNMIFIVVPVSEPSTMAAAGVKAMAPACIALSVSAMVTELDCTSMVITKPMSKKIASDTWAYLEKSKAST